MKVNEKVPRQTAYWSANQKLGENVLKIVLNEVQGQGTNIQTVEN